MQKSCPGGSADTAASAAAPVSQMTLELLARPQPPWYAAAGRWRWLARPVRGCSVLSGAAALKSEHPAISCCPAHCVTNAFSPFSMRRSLCPTPIAADTAKHCSAHTEAQGQIETQELLLGLSNTPLTCLTRGCRLLAMSCGASDLHSGLQLGNRRFQAREDSVSQLLLCCSQRSRQLPVQLCQDAQPVYSRRRLRHAPFVL